MLNKTLRKFTLSGLALVAMSSMIPAHALTYTVNYVPGTPLNTNQLTGFATSGDGMVGTSVTAYFVGGGSEQRSWAATGAGSGGVTGTGWGLSLSGDSFSAPWILTTDSAALAGLTIDGVPGRTIFDVINGPEGTPGSANGQPFSSVTGPVNLNITATYMNEVLLQQVFYGDEYGLLSLQFNNTGGLGRESTLNFVSDTDTSVFAISTVPEPMSLALFGIGLGGLGLMRRRQASL